MSKDEGRRGKYKIMVAALYNVVDERARIVGKCVTSEEAEALVDALVAEDEFVGYVERAVRRAVNEIALRYPERDLDAIRITIRDIVEKLRRQT